MAKRWIAILLGIAVMPLVIPSAMAQSECECNDIRDIRNRICEAKAAIAEYQRQIHHFNARESRENKPFMLTEERYRELMQPCVQEALNRVTDPKANHSTAKTNAGCEIEVFPKPNKPTACIEEALRVHETIHVQICRRHADVDSWEYGWISQFASAFRDYHLGLSMLQFAKEEEVAYQSELGFLRLALLDLSTRCPKSPFEVERPDGRREFTMEFCPKPKPPPPPGKSNCKVL